MSDFAASRSSSRSSTPGLLPGVPHDDEILAEPSPGAARSRRRRLPHHHDRLQLPVPHRSARPMGEFGASRASPTRTDRRRLRPNSLDALARDIGIPVGTDRRRLRPLTQGDDPRRAGRVSRQCTATASTAVFSRAASRARCSPTRPARNDVAGWNRARAHLCTVYMRARALPPQLRACSSSCSRLDDR